MSQSLAYFARVFEEATAAYLVTNPSLVITNANRAAERLFGRPTSQLKGLQMTSLVAESDRDTFLEIIASAILEAEKPVSRPLKLQIASGDAEIPFSATVLRDQTRAPESICWVFHDRHVVGGDDIL